MNIRREIKFILLMVLVVLVMPEMSFATGTVSSGTAIDIGVTDTLDDFKATLLTRIVPTIGSMILMVIGLKWMNSGNGSMVTSLGLTALLGLAMIFASEFIVEKVRTSSQTSMKNVELLKR